MAPSYLSGPAFLRAIGRFQEPSHEGARVWSVVPLPLIVHQPAVLPQILQRLLHHHIETADTACAISTQARKARRLFRGPSCSQHYTS